MRNKQIHEMMIASMLCAIGIVIPLFSPIKIILELASFTLASHVSIMIAMFLSPRITIYVVIGTTLGFFLGGFPLVVVARAASHIVFASVGSLILLKQPRIMKDGVSFILFIVLISILHAVVEVLVVLPFYMYQDSFSNFMYTLFVLVGIGTFIHSLIDFSIAKFLYSLPMFAMYERKVDKQVLS